MSANENKPSGEVILYQTEDLQTRLEVRLEGETVWLTQAQMAELFQTTIPNVSMHIRNVFAERELQADSVVKEFLTTAADGKNYTTKFHNLDVIISVGYRVKSHRGTQFRIWATKRLREYIVKGFTMDDERLKNPPGKGHTDYFDELLARIRLHAGHGTVAKVFCHGAEQNALGDARPHGGRDSPRAGGCRETVHGDADDAPRRARAERRRSDCQKLPHGKRIAGA
jgi:hypothetical protein